MLDADPSPAEIEDDVEPALGRTESRLCVSEIGDVHRGERREVLNRVEFNGKIRHRSVVRKRPSGHSKLRTIPAMLYPQLTHNIPSGNEAVNASLEREALLPESLKSVEPQSRNGGRGKAFPWPAPSRRRTPFCGERPRNAP